MMKTTAFLTLTGSGTVMKLWLTQILTAGAAAPELLLLCIAVAGLGLQALHSDPGRERAQRTLGVAGAIAPSDDDLPPEPVNALSRV